MTDEQLHQLSLFEGPYRIAGHGSQVSYTTWRDWEDEVCPECQTACTSSKECVEISGLYDD